MGYKSTKTVKRSEAISIIEDIKCEKFSNEGLAQLLEVISDWYDNDGIGYNNYIVED